MARKHSRLSTLRKLRAATRDEHRRRLAEAMQAEEVLDQRSHEFQQESDALQAARAQAAAPALFDLNQLVNAQRYALVLAAELSTLESQKAVLDDETSRRRQALVHADGEVRAVERLAKRQVEMERRNLSRQENNELDETAVQMFNRRKE